MFDTPIDSPIDRVPDDFAETTHAELDNIGKWLADVEVAVMSNAIDKLSEIESHCANVQAVLMGRIGVGVDEVGKACQKVRDKIAANSLRTTQAMYEYMGQAGFQVPSAEQVQVAAGLLRSGVGIDELLNAPQEPIADEFFRPQSGIQQIDQPLPLPVPDTGTQPPTSGTVSPIAEVDTTRGGVLTPIYTPPTADGCPVLNIASLPYSNPQQDWIPGTPQPQAIRYTHECFRLDPTGIFTAWRYTGQVVTSGPGGGIQPPGSFIIIIRQGYVPLVQIIIPTNAAIVQGVLPGYLPPLLSGEPFQVVSPGCWQIVADYVKAAEACPWSSQQGQTKPDQCNVCGCDPCECNRCEKPEVPKAKRDPPAELPRPAPIKADDICKAIADSIERMGGAKCDLASVFALHPIQIGGIGLIKTFVQTFLGSDAAVIPELVHRFAKWLCDLIEKGVDGLDCQRDKLIFISVFEAAVRFVDRWTNAIPRQIIEQSEILSRTVCQSRLPTGGMADVAYLRGDIDRETWECYHKAAGDHIQPAEKIMMAGRSKLDPSQLDKLRRRKLITDAEFDQFAREAGVMKDEDKKHIQDWNLQFPTHSEISMLLMRDVFDEVNIDWSESDKVFKQKYVGKAKDWFDANGIPEEMAKLFWRGHWHLPSYTMGQQFLFRRRPGADGVDKPFTEEDFRQLLLQDDWHPNYIDHMIATAYRPVTRRDFVRAYMVHSITEVDLLKRFMDIGYDINNAGFYVQYQKRVRDIADRKASGYPTLRTLTNMFARCELTEEQFRDTVSKLVIDEDQEKAAIEAAILSRQVWQRKQSVNAIKRPYILGVLDRNEAVSRLQSADVDPSCVESLLSQWDLLAMRQDRHIAVGKLCEMIETGTITPAQMVFALVRMGYSREDAGRIAESCAIKVEERQIRRAEAFRRRQEADMRRAMREAEKLRRLQECGPPACPTNTPGGQKPSAAGQKNQGPSSNGTAPTTPAG